MFSLRFVAELMRLAGELLLTERLRRSDKVGLGGLAFGFLIIISSGLPQVFFHEIFLYDYGSVGFMIAFEVTGFVDVAVLFTGIAILLVGLVPHFLAGVKP